MSAGPAPTGFVYFAQPRGGGPFKVGWAVDVGRRIAELQVGNPSELVVAQRFRAVPALEARLHAKLEPWRLRGEWFHATRDARDSAREVIGDPTALSKLRVVAGHPSGGRMAVCAICRDALAPGQSAQALAPQVVNGAARILADGLRSGARPAFLELLERHGAGLL